MKALTLRVPDELHRQARLLSVERGEPLNKVLVELLQKWVEHFAPVKP